MTLIAKTSALNANLAALGETNADLAQLLRDVQPSPDLRFLETPEGDPSATYRDKPLASRKRPRTEAKKLVEHVDVVENAAFIICGFGLGYHVQEVARQVGKRGLVVVFEPDVALLRAVFEQIDHSTWLKKSNVVFVHDPNDRASLTRKLTGCEPILAIGLEFIDHPASRTRLGIESLTFSETFTMYMASMKTTLMTTLIRSLDTIRNNLFNLPQYVGGEGIAELKDLAKGCPGVVVSAGPSLHRNIHELATEGVRDRCVIIATQTTLKPLLQAGVKPHFVTALDYHEISKRFYEDLDPRDLREVTLVVEAKAHPIIIESFPGPVRCCGVNLLDKLLGEHARDMGRVPMGSTVAHLAMYLARHLGCNPIAMIGQDLGFPDGLYYAPGTAIEQVWGPELNPFNTMEMMQWQRIARHRGHLSQVEDQDGKLIYTDLQMTTYLTQFERDFAQFGEEGIQIIDATQGGVAKQHVSNQPLKDVLNRYAIQPLPAMPLPPLELNEARLTKAHAQVGIIRRSIGKLREVSNRSIPLLRRMIQDQHDPAKMDVHFRKMDTYRAEVDQRMDAFSLIGYLNQLGEFKRLKADRRLDAQIDLDPMQRQHAELQRDLTNVQWIEEAAEEMIDLLAKSERLMKGERIETRSRIKDSILPHGESSENKSTSRIGAMLAIDPSRFNPDARFEGKHVLQVTLERLGQSKTLDSIVLIAPQDIDVESLIDRSALSLPLHLETCDGSPFGPEHEAILAARRWSENSWRGGISGITIYDEALCPQRMHEAMKNCELDAAVVVGCDWPLVQVEGEQGLDGIVLRHLDCPHKLELVFTQAPPGFGCCLISSKLMAQLAQRNRLSTIGALLVYQPHAPQPDPIALDANVQIDHRVRDSLIRVTSDTNRNTQRIEQALKDNPGLASQDAPQMVRALETLGNAKPDHLPKEIILELTPRRSSHGLFHRSLLGDDHMPSINRPDLSMAQAKTVFQSLSETDDIALTLGGLGDPLLHDRFDEIIGLAHEAGLKAIHVRTELLADQSVLDRLLACPLEVISVDLHADRAATYETMMGFDRFKQVLLNLDHLLANRRRMTSQGSLADFALPWIVPRLQRRSETFEDLESFYDRWTRTLGAAVIEAPPPFDASPHHTIDNLLPAGRPFHVEHNTLRRRMIILSDGTIPISELDVRGESLAGNATTQTIQEIWPTLLKQREALINSLSPAAQELRTFLP